MTKKPWQGRFDEKTSRILEEFSESISYDRELYPQDIRGSMAHARMLGKRGIIPAGDARLIVEELKRILAELDAGAEPWDKALEDVHMNIETLLTARIGEAGGRLHTARSRNDQVALDLTLYVRETSTAIALSIVDLLDALVTRSEEHVETVVPGYTHLQRAQPVLLAHHLMAYFEMLRRDHVRFTALAQSLDLNPLGAGALAGTPHPIDRHMTANELGFRGVTRNSMDTVSNRDFAAEFLFASALAQVHLSRLAEEVVLWATAEFSFVTLPDAFATGSSMMPQKKNPDSAELVRGKTGRMIGNLTSLLVTLKGLPMTYNRDLQEDKEPVFDSARTLAGSLEIMTGLVLGLAFNNEAMAEAADDGFSTATDLADYLVGKGVPFRQAHEITGNLVALCLEKRCGLPDLTLAEMKKRCDLIEEGVFEALDVRSSISRRDVIGGTAYGQVAGALEEAREWLDTFRGN
ncbi:MAG: argininosuccinate lyase [bacterium]|nr:argininosuccinate lyase [bacterium]MDT8395371.1 argininosuccinate lyase [bacterium]